MTKQLGFFLLALAIAIMPASAGTITQNFFKGGNNKTAPTHTYSETNITDPDTGVVFDAEILLTAAGGTGNLRTNGGTTAREFGVEGGNAAIDSPTESITATLQSLTVTDFNGNDPSDVTVSFDGFASLIIYFVGNLGDAGEIVDGSNNVLFGWEGTLDPSENGGSPAVDLGSAPFTFGVAGGGTSQPGSNALIDLSGSLPSTLVAQGDTHSNPPTTGTGDDNNRWRVDDYTAQFTVTVVEPIPEPTSVLLLVLGSAALTLAGRRNN